MSDLILIADDDPDIARFVEVNLQLDGFDVIVANEGEEALRMAQELQPALVLLDVMIAGLTAGADDYIIKPFDPLELVARVRSTLRRTREMRAQSPLTGLPGNVSIETEVTRRMNGNEPLALTYADLDNFKAYNDHYGFLRGDQILVFTANVVSQSAAEEDAEAFVGHIGGDDFLIITTPAAVEPLCKKIIERFDAGVGAFYDQADLDRGYIEVENRQKVLVRYPVLSISVGVAVAEPTGVALITRQRISYFVSASAPLKPGSDINRC